MLCSAVGGWVQLKLDIPLIFLFFPSFFYFLKRNNSRRVSVFDDNHAAGAGEF